MLGRTRTRALTVIASATVAATVVAMGSTGAFGAAGHRFVSSPNQARVGHIPNTLKNRSISPCPAGATTVDVKLTQNTTTYASAQATADAKGKWTVFMSIPANLKTGLYAITASCSTAGGPAALSYKPQNFRVLPPSCGPEPTTSTTARCRPVLRTSTTSAP